MAKAKPSVIAVTLATIVAATQSEVGFQYAPAAVFTPLALDGLVEVNQELKDAAGNFATRATQKGIDKIMAATKPAETSAPAVAAVAAASAFVIESGIAMPAVSGRGRTGNTYPFDLLELGQSFFVPNSEKKPNAAKSLASTVSSANARYAEALPGQFKTSRKGVQVPATKQVRNFVVRSVDGGARIWRTV